jgi:predicted phage terminase large subunit-like protein
MIPFTHDPTETTAVLQTMPVEVRAELAKRVLARKSLLYFTKKFHPSYLAGWVHEDICRRLEKFSQDVRDRKSPRLMLLMPPRHGKSELASIRFPAWHLGHCPEHEIINCGYNLDLPMRFSRKVRENVRDPAYKALFDQTVLDPDSQSTEAWLTTMGGGFTAAGVGGGITGKGAHVLIIDDPIKNQEEADSVTTRNNLWDWYWTTAYSRLAPGAGVLIIQTWWHDDDLAGRLQSKMDADLSTDQFELVKYPAIAEYDEYWDNDFVIHRVHPEHEAPEPGWRLIRRVGDPLHEERYNKKMMLSMKANQPPRVWSALYQQNPVPDEGMYFQKEWFKYELFAPSPKHRNVYQAWDFAIGEKQHNDWTVGVTIVQDEMDYLHVVEVVRFKGDSFTIIEEVLNAAARWSTGPTAPLTLGFEDSQIWRSIRPLLLKRMSERGVYPPYEELKPLTDKLARARSLQGRLQQGRVYLLEGAPWRQQVVQEMLRFPAGTNDDVVDAMAWAVNLCVGKAPRMMPVPKSQKSWKDKVNTIDAPDAGHMSA